MAKARYYLLTGEIITGEEAERLGMVSKAVPRDQVLDEALRVADSLATGSQPAIRWTKRALNNWLKIAGPIFDQSAAYEMLTFMGPDVLEGAAALTEKRAPGSPRLTTLSPRLAEPRFAGGRADRDGGVLGQPCRDDAPGGAAANHQVVELRHRHSPTRAGIRPAACRGSPSSAER